MAHLKMKETFIRENSHFSSVNQFEPINMPRTKTYLLLFIPVLFQLKFNEIDDFPSQDQLPFKEKIMHMGMIYPLGDIINQIPGKVDQYKDIYWLVEVLMDYAWVINNDYNDIRVFDGFLLVFGEIKWIDEAFVCLLTSKERWVILLPFIWCSHTSAVFLAL